MVALSPPPWKLISRKTSASSTIPPALTAALDSPVLALLGIANVPSFESSVARIATTRFVCSVTRPLLSDSWGSRFYE